MIVRNKISYSAFMKKMTINELFFRTIHSTYLRLQEEGSIPFDVEKEKKY
jgi:hypothetical protein